MARIRTVKPEFWTSEQVVECSPTARLLFIGLWNFCDDAGRHPDSPLTIKMRVFPGDAMGDGDIEELLDQIVAAGLIVRYEWEDKAYLEVTGWSHQKIESPSFRFPSASGRIGFDEPSANAPPRSRKGREGKTRSTGADDHARALTEHETSTVRARANEVATTVGRRATTPQDRSLVLKACILSLRAPFSEQWLYGASQGVAKSKGKKSRPYAYLHKCLADGALKFGRTLNEELAHIKIPEELEKPPPLADDMSERLCAQVGDC